MSNAEVKFRNLCYWSLVCFLLAILFSVLSSCQKVEAQNGQEYYQVDVKQILVDDCEYIIWQDYAYKAGGITHKGNCINHVRHK